MNPTACFVAGTVVLTVLGQTAIEEIEVGDYVWASDPETGETAPKRVVQTFVNQSDELVHLTVNGETITTTPTHPFDKAGQGWFRADSLRAGDILVTVNGEYVILEQVQHELLESPITVYNFEVEDFHTYFVGDDDGVLVHNACIGSRGQLRRNMLKEGPAPGPNYQAHHGLPWEHKDYFAQVDLNVNDTQWGRWVKGGGNGGHQSWSKKYGEIWTEYRKNHQTPNREDIIDLFYKLNGGR